jgi:hypothetical protein
VRRWLWTLDGKVALGNIDTAEYLEELHSIASLYPFKLESPGFQSDVAEWSRKHCVPDEKPLLCGKTLRNQATGGYLICLLCPITPDVVGSVSGGLAANGFDTRELEDNPRQFVRHLMLHEIAHALDHSRKEIDCDYWAFAELKKLPSNGGPAGASRHVA